MDFPWETSNWTSTQRCGRIFGQRLQMAPSLVMRTHFWLEILNEPWLGDFEGVWVGNCDGEVIRQ